MKLSQVRQGWKCDKGRPRWRQEWWDATEHPEVTGTKSWMEMGWTRRDSLKPFTWNSELALPPREQGLLKGAMCLRVGAGAPGWDPPPLAFAWGQRVHPFPVLNLKMNLAHQHGPPSEGLLPFLSFGGGRPVFRGNLTLDTFHSDMSEMPMVKQGLPETSRKSASETSLVAQWLRIHLSMQGTRVGALVREDPTCHGATKPMRHNYWACVPQLLKPTCLEPVLHNKRSHRNKKPVHCNEE